MFHFLHKLVVYLCYAMLVGLLFVIYENRAVFSPVVDLIEVVRLRENDEPKSIVKLAGIVTRVPDGASLQFKDDQGQSYYVQLTGVEVPVYSVTHNKEQRQTAKRCHDYLRDRVLSNRVEVAFSFLQGTSGLGLVYVGKTNINATMVAAGHATLKRDYMKGLPFKDQYALVRARRSAEEKSVQ
jgi:endonuclease YncB( thermonuclease family)